MRPAFVVEADVAPDSSSRRRDAFIGVQIDLFVLNRFPEPLDEHVVAPASLAVHADGDVVVLEQRGEVCAVELASLIGVEDLRASVLRQRFLDGLEQKSMVRLAETRHATPRRLVQSITAAK
jgi:hypothetical protein